MANNINISPEARLDREKAKKEQDKKAKKIKKHQIKEALKCAKEQEKATSEKKGVKYKILKVAKMVPSSIAPLSVASALAVRMMCTASLYCGRSIDVEYSFAECFENGNFNIKYPLMGVVAFLAVRSFTKTVYKIRKRRTGKEVGLLAKVAIALAEIAAGAAISMISFYINKTTKFPLEIFSAIAAVAGAKVWNLISRRRYAKKQVYGEKNEDCMRGEVNEKTSARGK